MQLQIYRKQRSLPYQDSILRLKCMSECVGGWVGEWVGECVGGVGGGYIVHV